MRWMWIDQIIELVPNTRMVAIKNVSLAEEHLHDHFPRADGLEALPVVPSSLLIEGMAQTAGILVGAASRFRENVILAKIAIARFDCEVFPGQTVRYEAEIERIDPAGAATVGTVSRYSPTDQQPETIGRIDLMFSHIGKSMSGLELPSGNFVFGENLKLLFRSPALEALGLEAIGLEANGQGQPAGSPSKKGTAPSR